MNKTINTGVLLFLLLTATATATNTTNNLSTITVTNPDIYAGDTYNTSATLKITFRPILAIGYNDTYLHATLPKTTTTQTTKNYTCLTGIHTNGNNWWCDYPTYNANMTGTYTTIKGNTVSWEETTRTTTYTPPNGTLYYDHDNKDRWEIFVLGITPTNILQPIRIDGPTLPIGHTQQELYPEHNGKIDIMLYPATYGYNIQTAIQDNNYTLLDPTVNLSNGLQLRFSLDETTGNYSDSVANHQANVTANTARGVTGINGLAPLINSNNSHVRIMDTDFPNTNTINYTVSFWFRENETSWGDRWLVGDNVSPGKVFRINDATYCGGGTGKLYLSNWNGTGVECIGPSANTSYSDGRWHNVVLIYNYSGSARTAHSYQLWIDGHLDATDNTGSGLQYQLGQAHILGNTGSGSFSCINTTFDEFTWYNRPITGDEAVALYNATSIQLHSLSTTSVTPGNNITINISATFDAGPQTTNLGLNTITIGGYACTIPKTTTCDGTPVVCSNYTTQDYCESGGCTWGAITVLTTQNLTTVNSALGTGLTSPEKAYTDNNDAATCASGTRCSTNYTGFTLNAPAETNITNITVRVSAMNSNAAGTTTYTVRLWNGSAWGTEKGPADTTATLLNYTNNLGTNALTWTTTNIQQLRINITAPSGNGRDLSIDAVAVQINYTSTGCIGTPATCATYNANVTQCVRSNCTNGTTPLIAHLGNGTWQTNCTTSASCSGTSDVTITANHTVINTIANTTSIGACTCGTVASTCTYGGTGNWAITCSDLCNITTTTNYARNNITMTGTGTINVSGVLKNASIITITNACILKGNGSYIQ